jgi:hypothetical protein
MELGYLTHVGGLGSPRDAYRDTVELAVAAESAGFTSFWVAQHHASEAQGYLPSPFVLLAAVAQATSRIRLGTGVVAAARGGRGRGPRDRGDQRPPAGRPRRTWSGTGPARSPSGGSRRPG